MPADPGALGDRFCIAWTLGPGFNGDACLSQDEVLTACGAYICKFT